jgi:hypothetical protein
MSDRLRSTPEAKVPSKSGKQHRLMAAAAHDPTVRKKHGISEAIAREFLKADKGKKFSGPPRRHIRGRPKT